MGAQGPPAWWAPGRTTQRTETPHAVPMTLGDVLVHVRLRVRYNTKCCTGGVVWYIRVVLHLVCMWVDVCARGLAVPAHARSGVAEPRVLEL